MINMMSDHAQVSKAVRTFEILLGQKFCHDIRRKPFAGISDPGLSVMPPRFCSGLILGMPFCVLLLKRRRVLAAIFGLILNSRPSVVAIPFPSFRFNPVRILPIAISPLCCDPRFVLSIVCFVACSALNLSPVFKRRVFGVLF